MFKIIASRILQAIPVILAIVTLTFFMVRLSPGDPFSNEKISAETRARLNAHYGLDKPLWEQYAHYLAGLPFGDFGPAITHPGWTVGELIAERIPVSLELGGWALLVACTVGILAGLIASIKPNTVSDWLPMGFSMIGICLPTFVLGPLLVLFFGLYLEWFNVWGWILPQDRILPSTTLGLCYAAYIARLTRGSMVEVIKQDYIRTARAKGVPFYRIFSIHALRNALPPVLSFLGPAAAGLVSGSFVIETIFQIPGLGQMFVESALNNDHTILMGLTIFYGTLVIGFNLAVDILLTIINPKISNQQSRS